MLGKIFKAVASIAIIKWAAEKFGNAQPAKKTRRRKVK